VQVRTAVPFFSLRVQPPIGAKSSPFVSEPITLKPSFPGLQRTTTTTTTEVPDTRSRKVPTQ
jgi:hypothetical protein